MAQSVSDSEFELMKIIWDYAKLQEFWDRGENDE